MALASVEIELHDVKFLVSKLFDFPTRKITYPPVLLCDGKFARNASL